MQSSLRQCSSVVLDGHAANTSCMDGHAADPSLPRRRYPKVCVLLGSLSAARRRCWAEAPPGQQGVLLPYDQVPPEARRCGCLWRT